MAANVHPSPAQLFGMRTGPLMSRMSSPSKAFVAALLVAEDGAGRITADELDFIRGVVVSPGFQKNGPARRRRDGPCATGWNRCARRGTASEAPPAPWLAAAQTRSVSARRRC